MSTPTGLTCQELVELVTAYLDDAMTAVDRARFEAHLGTCAKCTTYVAQFRRTIALTGELREEHLPLDARDRMLAAFRDWKRSA